MNRWRLGAVLLRQEILLSLRNIAYHAFVIVEAAFSVKNL